MKKNILMAFLFLAFVCSINSEVFATADAMIAQGKTVKVHFSVKADGQLVDDTRGQEPVEFVIGESAFLPAFQEKIVGLKAGDEKTFSLGVEEAFGQPNPQAVVEVPRQNISAENVEEGMILMTSTEHGPMHGTVTNVSEEAVTLDFNHPLAGKDLDFEVEIVEVS